MQSSIKNKIIMISLIFSMIFISGCNVERLQIKLSDIEYKGTETGFIIKSYNYTDIIINEEIQARQAPAAIAINNSQMYTNVSKGIQMLTNVSKGIQMITNVTNNTINIKVIP
jgi:hypothetical protein